MNVKVTVKTQVNGQSVEKTAEVDSNYECRPRTEPNDSIEEEIVLRLLRALKKEFN